MLRRTLPILVLVAALLAGGALAVSATGAPTASAARTKRVHLRASSSALRFNVRTIHVGHGRVKLVMSNPRNAGLEHAIAVSGHGVNRSGRIVGPGHSSSVTVSLRRGTYTFFCPVPGHRAAGMRGTLVVS
jgi:plastocyanin